MISLNAPGVLDRLRLLPTTYDLVIGDFGREAAARYVSLLAEEERLWLTRLLTKHGLPFLDEYRRIMFAHVGDVAFLKSAAIERVWANAGHLTDEVLVAIKGHDVPADLVTRFACVIHDEALLAVRRGHSRVRVTLPCNALSETLEQSVDLVRDGPALKSAYGSLGYRAAWIDGTILDLSAHGVVQSAISQLARTGQLKEGPFVVLGARMAREQYSRLGRDRGMTVLSLTTAQQIVIDEAVVASIEGSAENLARAKAEITDAILTPLRSKHPSLLTLEACTDFDFGLGFDSVRLMAQHMVHECYEELTMSPSDERGVVSMRRPTSQQHN